MQADCVSHLLGAGAFIFANPRKLHRGTIESPSATFIAADSEPHYNNKRCFRMQEDGFPNAIAEINALAVRTSLGKSLRVKNHVRE